MAKKKIKEDYHVVVWPEWIAQKAGELSTHNFSNQHPRIAHDWLLKMLLEYDKLNGDRWERLKEFVLREILRSRDNELATDKTTVKKQWQRTQIMGRIILAEIGRLEKEGK